MNLDDPSQSTTLIDLLRYRAFHQPTQTGYTFLVDGETAAVSLTYQALDRQARAIAAHLQSLCSSGDRALLLYPPGLDYIAAFFGCLYAGILAVPAYPPRPNRSLARLQTIAADAQTSLALTTYSTLAKIGRQFAQTTELNSLYWLTTDNIDETLAQAWRQPKNNGDTPAFLQYTSGSTAAPKGVVITHKHLLHNLGLIHQCFGHTPDSKGMIWLPLYHDMGLIGGVLQPLYGGFPVTLMSSLMFLQSPLRWLQAISRYKATTSGGPNFAYDLCVRKITSEQRESLDLSSWEVAFNAAEPICPETLEQFAMAFAGCGFRREAFYPCYGMAEATLIISGGLKTTRPVCNTFQGEALAQNRVVLTEIDTDSAPRLVSCGQTLPDQQIVIVHPERLSQCQEGEVGEIWVTGASVAQGYWNQPEETQRTFNAYLADTQEGPFLRTGDLGFLIKGELFVTGRLKGLIIINGCNYYPQDIERTVEQSHPAVRPNCCAAFSVEMNGAERLIVVAELERRSRRHRQPTVNSTRASVKLDALTVNELKHVIKRAVSKTHDLPLHAIRFLKYGTIPKTSSGKIQRHVCRASFLAGTLTLVTQ